MKKNLGKSRVFGTNEKLSGSYEPLEPILMRPLGRVSRQQRKKDECHHFFSAYQLCPSLICESMQFFSLLFKIHSAHCEKQSFGYVLKRLFFAFYFKISCDFIFVSQIFYLLFSNMDIQWCAIEFLHLLHKPY